MARGWESKAVEDQISAREAEAEKSKKSDDSQLQREQRAKREGLLLARARTVNTLRSTKDARYRTVLEAALAHLDSLLAEPEAPDSGS